MVLELEWLLLQDKTFLEEEEQKDVNPFAYNAEMLSKYYKICKRDEFVRCYTKGEKYITKHYVLFVYKTSFPLWRIGVTVTRKIGNAVLRNRFKRIVRAFFYKYATSWYAGYDFILLSKLPLHTYTLSLDSVEKEILPLMQTKCYMDI